jgi:alpha-tubulin suppressor-like RCC1 family protein
LGHNNRTHYSSPVQIPGTTWKQFSAGNYNSAGVKTDGTMWTWGFGNTGRLGHNQEGVTVSSPTQIPGTTWKQVCNASDTMFAVKTDGTLWGWGNNQEGRLGVNDTVRRSSPTQVPGTTWAYVGTNIEKGTIASKTDGTLWSWGSSTYGQLGLNAFPGPQYSSPVQIPGTDWGTALSKFGVGGRHFAALQVT